MLPGWWGGRVGVASPNDIYLDQGEAGHGKPESVFIYIGTCPDEAAAGRQAADNAWRVLADPTAREAYDVEIGSGRPGEEF